MKKFYEIFLLGKMFHKKKKRKNIVFMYIVVYVNYG